MFRGKTINKLPATSLLTNNIRINHEILVVIYKIY